MKISLPAVLSGLGIISLVATLWAVAPTVQPTIGRQSIGAQSADVIRSPVRSGRAGMTGVDLGGQLSNRELATQSDLIVIGRADDTSSFWADGGRNLFTLVTVAVEETLKGDQGSTVSVALPGGIDANRKFPIAMTYPGAPRISPDEEVFLFLVHADDEVGGSYAVTGFSQGKLAIEGGGGGVGLRRQAGDRMVRVGDTLVSLATFKEEIQGYLRQ